MNDTYTEKIRSLQLPASVIDRLNASGQIMNVMGPVHPERTAFCNALGGKGYCNFVKGHHNFVVGVESWDRQHDHSHTRALLASRWPEIDVEATLELFREHGGFCDCEVLFSVSESWENSNA